MLRYRRDFDDYDKEAMAVIDAAIAYLDFEVPSLADLTRWGI